MSVVSVYAGTDWDAVLESNIGTSTGDLTVLPGGVTGETWGYAWSDSPWTLTSYQTTVTGVSYKKPEEFTKDTSGSERIEEGYGVYRKNRYSIKYTGSFEENISEKLSPGSTNYWSAVVDGITDTSSYDTYVGVNENGECELFVYSTNTSRVDGDRLALMVYVNDALQTITVDGEETCGVYNYDLDYGDLVMIPVSFKPICNEAVREENKIRILVLFGLNDEDITYEDIYRSPSILSVTTSFLISSENISNTESPEIIKIEYPDKNKISGTSLYYLNEMKFNKDGAQLDLNVTTDEGRFAIYTFIDGSPVSISDNGEPGIIWYSLGYEVAFPAYFDFSNLKSGEHVLWTILVPDIIIDPNRKLIPIIAYGHYFTIN